jgi:hypothetical protein
MELVDVVVDMVLANAMVMGRHIEVVVGSSAVAEEGQMSSWVEVGGRLVASSLAEEDNVAALDSVVVVADNAVAGCNLAVVGSDFVDALPLHCSNLSLT